MSSRSPIPGTKDYTIDLFSHEIFNAEGKRMKPFVDGRGRVSIKMVRTDGKRSVYIVKDVVRKLSYSENKQSVLLDTQHSLNTYTQFFEHADYIMSKGGDLDKYLSAKAIIKNGDVQIIKKLIKFLS